MRKKSKSKITISVILAFCMLFLVSAPVMAKDDNVSLTLEEAIKKGYANSIELEKAGVAVKDAENTQKSVYEALQTNTITYVQAQRANSANLAVQTASSTYNQTKDKVAYDITKKYWDVKKYQEHLKVAELSYKKAQSDLGIARLNAAVGLGTNATVLAAESKNAQAKTSLESAQYSLNTAYSVFNVAVGLNRDARPVLSEEVADFKPIYKNSLSVEISQAITSNPNLWTAQQSALIAQNTANGVACTPGKSYYDYQSALYSADTSNLTVKGTERTLSTTVESLFYQVETLNQTYKQLLVTQQAAAEACRIKKLMYEVGTGTQNDVLGAESDLASANMGINDSKYSNSLLAIAFEKPWVLS